MIGSFVVGSFWGRCGQNCFGSNASKQSVAFKMGCSLPEQNILTTTLTYNFLNAFRRVFIVTGLLDRQVYKDCRASYHHHKSKSQHEPIGAGFRAFFAPCASTVPFIPDLACRTQTAAFPFTFSPSTLIPRVVVAAFWITLTPWIVPFIINIPSWISSSQARVWIETLGKSAGGWPDMC